MSWWTQLYGLKRSKALPCRDFWTSKFGFRNLKWVSLARGQTLILHSKWRSWWFWRRHSLVPRREDPGNEVEDESNRWPQSSSQKPGHLEFLRITFLRRKVCGKKMDDIICKIEKISSPRIRHACVPSILTIVVSNTSFVFNGCNWRINGVRKRLIRGSVLTRTVVVPNTSPL